MKEGGAEAEASAIIKIITITARVASADVNAIIKAEARARGRINSKINIFTIIFIIREFYKRYERNEIMKIKRAKVIKSFINMLFAKRLLTFMRIKKRFLTYLNREQCDLNYVIT